MYSRNLQSDYSIRIHAPQVLGAKMTTNKLCADKAIIAQFISEITKDWSKTPNQVGIFEIRCLGENRTPIAEQFTLTEMDQAADLALQMNKAKLNVYLTINPINPSAVIKAGKGATDIDMLRAHYSFADADDQQGLDGLNKLVGRVEPDMIVTTGTVPHERCHAYWRLAEPCCDLTLWRLRQTNIATQCQTDRAVVNPSRIMRVAGTVNYPSQQKLTRGYVPELVTLKVRAD